jgi:hypothetical protein
MLYNVFSQYFSFPLSLPFHLCSILMSHVPASLVNFTLSFCAVKVNFRILILYCSLSVLRYIITFLTSTDAHLYTLRVYITAITSFLHVSKFGHPQRTYIRILLNMQFYIISVFQVWLKLPYIIIIIIIIVLLILPKF